MTSSRGSIVQLKSTIKSLNLFQNGDDMEMEAENNPNYTVLSFEQLINNLNGVNNSRYQEGSLEPVLQAAPFFGA